MAAAPIAQPLRRPSRVRTIRKRAPIYAGLTFYAVLAGLPVYWMIITTFKPDQDLYNLKSFPLFFNVDYHTEVKPLPRFASRSGKERPALRAGEHLFAQTAQTFAYLRSRVEAGELVLPDGSLRIGQFGQQALQNQR